MSARARLVDNHAAFARMLAASVFSRRMHDDIEFGEYFQLAMVGLLESVDKFVPEKGRGFRAYASKRIRGAILSGIEKLTEKNQQIAARRNLRNERLGQIKQDAAQAVSGVQYEGSRIAAKPADSIFQFLSEVGVELALGILLEGTGMIDADAFGLDSGYPSAQALYFKQSEIESLRRAVRELMHKLTAKERFVVQAHYLQEIPFESIAGILGVTRARVSQLHRQALARLRQLLQAGRYADVYA